MKLSDITVENSTGYAVLGVNILGDSSISHSRFIFNNYYTKFNKLFPCTAKKKLLFQLSIWLPQLRDYPYYAMSAGKEFMQWELILK